MKTNHIIPALLFGISLSSQARTGPPGPPPDPVVIALDKDRDREISSREIRNAAKSLLKLDKDHDKSLSAEELRPEPPRGKRRRNKNANEEQNPPHGPPPSAIFKAIDTDSSGDISGEELAAAPESLLELDEDGNGKLDSGESGIGEGPPGGGNQGGDGPPSGGPPPRGSGH